MLFSVDVERRQICIKTFTVDTETEDLAINKAVAAAQKASWPNKKRSENDYMVNVVEPI